MSDVIFEVMSRDEVNNLFNNLATPENISNINAQLADMAYNVKHPPTPLNGAKGDWNGTSGTDDKAALQAIIDYAFSLNRPVTIDLAGSSYLLSSPLLYPPGNNVSLINGELVASDTFPSDQYLIELNKRGLNGTFANQDINFQNLIFDNRHHGGGIYLEKYNRVNMSNIRFFHFSTDGIKTNTASDAHELFADKLFFAEYLWDDADRNTGTNTGIALNIGTNDNHFSGILVANADIGFKVNAQYNFFNNFHIWGCKTWGIYITQNAAHVRFKQVYIDGVKILIENPYHVEFDGKFLASTSDATFSFFILKPMSSGIYIKGLKITNSAFINNVSTTVKMISLDTSVGTFNAGQVNQSTIENNSFDNVSPRYTKFTKRLYATGATSFSVDFSDVLIIGVIQKALYSFKTDGGTYMQNWISSLTSTGVTITTSSACNGTVYIEVDVNND